MFLARSENLMRFDAACIAKRCALQGHKEAFETPLLVQILEPRETSRIATDATKGVFI
jgi:hypothetical protein